MSNVTITIITICIALVSNAIGLVYSWLILYTDVFRKYRLQGKKYKPELFLQRLPLISFNIIILLIVTAVSLYFLAGIFEQSVPSVWVFCFQVFFIFFVDDIYFYVMHRAMHENKFLLRKIHYIHHRAITPFPLEYIYVHPLEWFIGSFGSFLGIILLMLFMPVNLYAFWAYAALRNLHEIDIHSGLESPLSNMIPLFSPTEHHDLHHEKVKGNYASTLNIWDRVFGTTLKKD